MDRPRALLSFMPDRPAARNIDPSIVCSSRRIPFASRFRNCEIVCIKIGSRKSITTKAKGPRYFAAFGPDASGGTKSVVTLDFRSTRIEAASNIQELSKTWFAAGQPAGQWRAYPKTWETVVSPGEASDEGILDLGVWETRASCVSQDRGQSQAAPRTSPGVLIPRR